MAFFSSSGSNLLHCSTRWFVRAFHLSTSSFNISISFCRTSRSASNCWQWSWRGTSWVSNSTTWKSTKRPTNTDVQNSLKELVWPITNLAQTIFFHHVTLYFLQHQTLRNIPLSQSRLIFNDIKLWYNYLSLAFPAMLISAERGHCRPMRADNTYTPTNEAADGTIWRRSYGAWLPDENWSSLMFIFMINRKCFKRKQESWNISPWPWIPWSV